MTKEGVNAWFRPARGEDIVGHVVRIEPDAYIVTGAVMVHEHGTVEAFQTGTFDGPDRPHVSRLCVDDEELSIPRWGTIAKEWRGDLDTLRAWDRE